MNDPNNPKIMSDVLKNHYIDITDDIITSVLLPLEIINDKNDAEVGCMENKVSGFVITIKINTPNFFKSPLLIMVNPIHETQKREIRVFVLEGTEKIQIDERETDETDTLDAEKVFKFEESVLIVELHTKLSDLKHKVLSEKYAGK